ncbi:MAG: DUF4037 domain-containing protein [Spirochaetaceae bacterium]|jgi:hypothetical protein|nr:DUF4037 domain-containing protein [Spirochaetaceae bacterium]
MKYKVKILVEQFVDIISKWDGIECITLNEAALPDTLDPYFALILDVFYSGTLPESAERLELYGKEAAAFETTGSKDRFLVGDIPLRFEFKSINKIDELVSIADSNIDSLHLIKDSGTYTFYRLTEGEILFSRGQWISTLRKRLSNLSDEFWNLMRYACQSKMEHFLSDLGAALIQDDDFSYLMSSAGFIKNACLALFCINKCFEPSHRQYYKKALELPIQPTSFCAQLETFLRTDAESTMERKYSTAQIIARGVISL